MRDEIRVRPEDVEGKGTPGLRAESRRIYHRFHIGVIDAWGSISFEPDHRGIAMHGLSDRGYLAAYLEEQLRLMNDQMARQWIGGQRVIEVPAGWIPRSRELKVS